MKTLLLAALLIRPEAIRAHMSFLADDLLEGRGTATRGQEIASRYIASHFESLGLATTLQTVPLKRSTITSGNPSGCAVVDHS